MRCQELHKQWGNEKYFWKRNKMNSGDMQVASKRSLFIVLSSKLHQSNSKSKLMQGRKVKQAIFLSNKIITFIIFNLLKNLYFLN